MSFREYLSQLDRADQLCRVSVPVSKEYEAAGVIKALEPKAVLFSAIRESRFQVAGGLFTGKAQLARYFGIQQNQLIPALAHAISSPSQPARVDDAPCQHTVNLNPDLDELPILRHCQQDGGNYISSGVVVTSHPDWGQNLDFHRFMQISKTEMAVRVVRSRHFDAFLKDQRQIPAAICVGVPPAVLIAGATSVDIGVDELTIANTLSPLQVVKAKTVDLWVPADCEFIIEGFVDGERLHPEGPFVDLTGTYDIVRDQPVFTVTAITHREDAIWHGLLPGGLEHKLLMGMPREPTIFAKVNEVVDCLDVHITPGGASWLHAVVQIRKHAPDDGKKAIEAAFAGHRSCKHVFVVDEDIDIYDPHQVEWAMATRFQGDRDMLVMPPEQGSSLDPSADLQTHFTTKIGFDLTAPLGAAAAGFQKAPFPAVQLEKYLTHQAKS